MPEIDHFEALAGSELHIALLPEWIAFSHIKRTRPRDIISHHFDLLRVAVISGINPCIGNPIHTPKWDSGQTPERCILPIGDGLQ